MGNFEKLVVLAVLLVAALVLALSFNRGGKEAEAADPLSGARHALEGNGQLATETAGSTLPPGDEPVQGETLDGKTEPSLLLNAGDEGAADFGAAPAGLHAADATTQPSSSPSKALAIQPESDPSRPILTGTVGLRPSFLEDHMVYTVAEGDTWASLAQRFYQDGRYTRNLMQANDEVQLTPGEDILVPKYDFLAVEAAPRTAGATSEFLTPGTLAAATPAPKPEVVAPPSGAKALEYEVKPGDTLSDISLAVFGTATRWKELLDANSALLRTPESLQVGMKLKIPEGGKLPVAGAAKSAPVASAKKPEAKPKAEPKTETAPKKKKVL